MKTRRVIPFFLAALFGLLPLVANAYSDNYLVGVGKYDGPMI